MNKFIRKASAVITVIVVAFTFLSLFSGFRNLATTLQTFVWHTSAMEGDGTEASALGISADAITNRELSASGVTPASYTFANFTVDDDGRLTAASNGTPVSDADKGDITTSSGATVWDIDAGVIGATEIASTAVAAGSYTYAGFTVDADGRLTAASSGASPLTDGSVYALLAGRASGQTLIGGTGTTDDLILQSTSGVGATGALIQMKVGNNGATTAMTILNDGKVGIGINPPTAQLDVYGTDASGVTQNIILSSSAAGSARDVRIGSNQGGIRFLSSPNALTSTPDGASFQMWGNSSGLPGQLYFDSGANNSAALVFRSTITSGSITERLRITAKGTILASNRVEYIKGANVASANDLTLGVDGNVWHITGTTTINAITTTDWQAGSQIILIFDSTPTVKNNTAGGANTAKMLLSGGVDLSATANDVLTLVYDGTSWFEMSRSIN